MKKLAILEVDKIEGNLGSKNKKNKNKEKKSNLPVKLGDGKVDENNVAMTAFEDIRWFVMANDIDNNIQDESKGINLILKGKKKKKNQIYFLSLL